MAMRIRLRDRPTWRWYWHLRAWWARLSIRLHGYPPRPPIDDIMRRIAADHPDDPQLDRWR